MVTAILNLLGKEIRGLHEAAYLLGVFALSSQFLALIRDRLLSHNFGAGTTLDVYYTAFRIPDFIFVSVASLVSLSVLIPFLTEKLHESPEAGKQFVQDIFSIFLLFIIFVSTIALVCTPWLLSFIAPGFVGSESFSDLIILTRILLLQPILLGLSSLFASVVHVYQKFVLYAAGPLLYNIGIIIGIIVFHPLFGLVGLAYGVVLGAVMHLLLQLPFVIAAGFFPKISFSINFKALRRVVILSLPRTLTLSAHQLVFIFLVALASYMAAGSIAIFNLSFNLQSVPLAIIGVSYSVAAFPTLARLFSNGSREEFFNHVTIAARHIIFWSLPALVLFIVLRAQIVRVILGSGEFTWTDTRLTAAALALFAVSILAQSLVLLFVRGYYAAGKTLKPLVVNVFSSLLAIFFAFVLVWLFENVPLWRYFIESLLRVADIPGTKVLMLPLGYSIALLINACLYWFLFQKDFSRFSHALSRTFFESLMAAIIMGSIAHVSLNVLDDFFDINTFLGIFSQGLLSGISGIIVGIYILYVLQNKEIREVWQSLHKKFWRAKVISSE